ncbi:MAG: hypothetical protein KKD83_02155 [Chloroflexi bacterium]|nr:hypothetical protein [Chloroflexota bacterium]
MKRKLVAFWKDESGVTVVLGALLMFVVVVSMYSMVQAYQVPIWNAEVEWEHFDTVNDDMMALKSDIEDAALLKAPKSSKIQMGMRYPNRMFLFNPGPGVPGALTSESVNVTVQYTLDVPGNPTFTRTYDSNRIAYQAWGIVDSPRLIYEHGLIIRDFGDAALSTTEQPLVEGDEIYIPLLMGGPLSLSSMETETVTLRPLTETFSSAKVKSAQITLATDYPQVWEDALAGVATADTTVTVNQTAKTVVIASTATRQIIFPSGNITTDALYAGMINLSTKFVPGAFSSIDITKNYPTIVDIAISSTGSGPYRETHSTITATVRNATAPFDIHADLTHLTGDPEDFLVYPDTSSPDSITATSWDIPNTNTVSWTNIEHPGYGSGEAILVTFWVYNTEEFMQYFTIRVFTRQSNKEWY